MSWNPGAIVVSTLYMRLFLCFALLACEKAPPPVAVSNTPTVHAAPHEVMATIARTGCYGWCPSYTVTIYRDGVVEYHGDSFVKQKGDHKGRLDPSEIAKLDALFAQAHYVQLKDSYTEYNVTDMPSVSTSYRPEGGPLKKIDHYLGDSSPPEGLGEVEDGLDAAVHIDQWIGTKAEREKFAREWR